MKIYSDKDIEVRLKKISSQLDRVEMEIAQARLMMDMAKYELIKSKIMKSR